MATTLPITNKLHVTPHVTDSSLIEELFQSVQDLMSCPADSDSRYYSVVCPLGYLSVSLFPATNKKWRTWEAEHRDTEPFDLPCQLVKDVAQPVDTCSYHAIYTKEGTRAIRFPLEIDYFARDVKEDLYTENCLP